MKKESVIVMVLLLVEASIGILSMFYLRDFYYSLVPGGRYGILHESEFSEVPLLGVRSGERIYIKGSSSKPITIGIVGNSSNPLYSLKDFYEYKNGTNTYISWVANQTQDYYIVILSIEAGDSYFSITAGKEPVSREFPFNLIMTMAIGGVISVVLFYYWYQVLVKDRKEDWKVPWGRLI